MISYVSGGALVPPHPHSEALYRDHEPCKCGGHDQVHSPITEIAAAAIRAAEQKAEEKMQRPF